MSDTPNNQNERPADRLASEELSELIVDALLRANIVRQQDVERAVKIATEEIEARKALGDY
jgi:hypothetical protein